MATTLPSAAVTRSGDPLEGPGALGEDHGHRDGGHRALVYDDPGAFVAGVGGFLRDGMRAGDHVAAVLTPEKMGWLRDELGADADALEYADADSFYARHGQMLSAMLDLVEGDRAPRSGRVRVVAEQALLRRAPVDVRAYMRYEAAANEVFGGYDASILCPYDTARLPDEIIEAALRTHPAVVEDGGERRSAAYMDPRAFVREYVHERGAPPAAPACRIERAGDIAAARERARAQAIAAGFGEDAVEDFTLAVSEIATNALLYGAGPRLVWSYVDGDDLVCQVRDAGSGPADPLVGYMPPDEDPSGGRGLWIAHQICDVVEVASRAEHTDVYVHMRLPR